MKMVRKTFMALMAMTLLSASAAFTQAQRQPYRGTFRTVRQLILRIDNRSDIFRNSVDARGQGRMNTGSADLGSLAEDLSQSVDQLRNRFDQRIVTTTDAQEVLNRAALVDQNIRNARGAAVIRNWNNLRSDLNQLASAFSLRWPTVGQTYPVPGQTYPVPGTQYSSGRLTGTYQLDPSRSDDPRQAANQATQTLPIRNRSILRDQLTARLESPDQLAIDLRGREVTIASTRAPQITFTADGIERAETMGGRTMRARATLNGDQLTVSSTGDRAREFNVTFSPIDNGARLSVVRRVYVEGLTRPVVVQSTYQRTSDVARFDINTGPGYPNTNPSGTDFIVQSGETVVGVLNGGLSTETAREGDRFSITVRQPYQVEGATIEGHVSNVQRSGRLTGRSQMTLNFDTIRLRNGQSYRFAGILESVRTAQGENVRIDNEGAVRDDSQTTRTTQRAAIGTAVGAIIGAIAGGGKGAAIGAIVGAGGGAGSVYVQGRDDLEIQPGSELTIRASGPR